MGGKAWGLPHSVLPSACDLWGPLGLCSHLKNGWGTRDRSLGWPLWESLSCFDTQLELWGPRVLPCVSVYVRESATPILCTEINEIQNHTHAPKPYQVLVSLYSNGNSGDSYLCRRCNLNEITYKSSIAPNRCVYYHQHLWDLTASSGSKVSSLSLCCP